MRCLGVEPSWPQWVDFNISKYSGTSFNRLPEKRTIALVQNTLYELLVHAYLLKQFWTTNCHIGLLLLKITSINGQETTHLMK